MIGMLQIVGGRTSTWYEKEGLRLSGTFDEDKEVYDYVDLEKDLYYWTNKLRAVQV